MKANLKKSIIELSDEELIHYVESKNQPKYRVDQIVKGMFHQKYKSFNEFSDISKEFRMQLEKDFSLRTFKLIDKIVSEKDGTTKFLWRLQDGKKIESVIIYDRDRVTFCISSQVGCPLDCQFCATGKMGLLRNLSISEIIEQVLQMLTFTENRLTNIVFMGMGEPLLNFENVIKAADLLTDSQGIALGNRRITISTSGIAKNIRRLADENIPYALAVSLNAVNQEMRESIMPIAKKYHLETLLAAVKYYVQKTKKTVTFEYVLMKNINDSLHHAKELIKITHGIKSKINVIPCNSDDPKYQPPSEEKIAEFDYFVNKKQKTVTVRNRKGWDIKAACGQLYAANVGNKK
jgi:23S rRNA (adenine2503-C2)-methyltransferase